MRDHEDESMKFAGVGIEARSRSGALPRGRNVGKSTGTGRPNRGAVWPLGPGEPESAWRKTKDRKQW